MGLIESLKKILKKEPRRQILRKEEFLQWLEARISEEKDKTNIILKAKEGVFNEAKRRVEQALSELESSRLMNPNIPERAKHLLEGNRGEFSRRVRDYLELGFSTEAEDFPSWKHFFIRKTAELASALEKPRAVLEEFLSEETTKVCKILSEIEELVLEKIEPLELFFSLNLIKKAVIEAEKSEAMKKTFLEKEKELAREVERCVKEITEKQSEILSLENGEGFSSLKSRFLEAKNEKGLLEKELREKFSPVKPLLVKYERISEHKALIARYVENPVEALATDLKLGIVGLLKSAALEVANGNLELKDRKKERALAEINALSEVYIRDWQRRYGSACSRVEELLRLIEKHPLREALARARKEENDLKEKKERLERELGETRKGINKIGNPWEKTILEARNLGVELI